MVGIAVAIGMIAVIPTSDTFASVMLGIPGSSASQATALDGFPLAKKGEAARALSAAFTSSLFGGILGVVVLTIILIALSDAINYVRSPTRFLLTLFGVAMVGILSGRSLLKGILAGGLGIFLGLMGDAPIVGVERFILWDWEPLRAFSDWTATFLPDRLSKSSPNGVIEQWQRFLRSGYGVAMIGLAMFAIPEIVDLLRQNKSIAGDAPLGLGWVKGFTDWWKNKLISLWNAFIGVIVGIIPGLGGSVVDWIAYGQTKAIVASQGHDVSQFGKGDIRGVIGPESANNAKEGGGLVPTLLLGIPGSGSMAVFIGMLSVLGIEAGPALFNNSVQHSALDGFDYPVLVTGMVIVFFMAWTLMLGNVMGTSVCFGLSAVISRLTKIPFPILGPFLLVIIFMASYKVSPDQTFFSILTLAVLGGLGVLLRRFKWSRPAVLIGFVLSGPMEKELNAGLNYIARGEMEFIDYTLVLIIGLMTAAIIAYGIIVSRRESKMAKDEGMEVFRIGTERWPNLVFTGFMTLIFGFMFFEPLTYGQHIFEYKNFNITDAQLPFFLACVFFPLSLIAFARSLFHEDEQELMEDEELDAKDDPAMAGRRSLSTAFGWVLGYALLIAIFGHIVATPIFCAAMFFSYSPLKWHWNLLLVVVSLVMLLFLADLVNARLVTGGLKRVFELNEWFGVDGLRQFFKNGILAKPDVIEPVLNTLMFWRSPAS